MNIRRIRLLGTGKYLPKRQVTAEVLSELHRIDLDWIRKHCGVETRYFVQDETASQMGALAAKQALNNANLSLADIDCLVSASGTMEQPIPCTASLIQKALAQLEGTHTLSLPSFDINSTCLSFLVALDTMAYLVEAGRYRRVLLVSTEVASAGLNWRDKESACLFGDGAAAVVIGPSNNTSSCILGADMETYGDGAGLSAIVGGGSKHPPYSQVNDQAEHYRFYMDGKGIFKLSAKILPRFYNDLLASTQLTTDDLKLVIPHQASRTACELIRQRLDIPTDKFHMIAHNHGNTIAASLPMGLYEAIHQRRLQRGDRFMLLGTSAGFSIGGMVLVY